MSTPVIMPKYEMAQETGTVLGWLKEEGDPIEKGETILEVETDKVTMEVEAPASGILVGIQAKAGEVVPVGRPIAHIVEVGEPWPVKTKERPDVAPEEVAGASPVPAGLPGRGTPVARRMAETHGIDLQAVSGSGSGGQVTKADIETYLATQRVLPALGGDKIRAVPAARRLARETGIDLKAVPGTGPDGRIQSADVRRVAIGSPVSPSPTDSRPAVRREIPLTGMRRAIAERMTVSVRQAPQFAVSVDVDMSRALAIVEDLRFEEYPLDGPRVTLTTFLVKACASALVHNPAVNAAVEEDRILEWAEVNIGVAVAMEEGLIVPVIHRADELGIREIAGRLAELTARARAGQLGMEDVQGGTFTLSNLGMFGVDRFTAILNPPQAAILAVGRVMKRPLVMKDGRVEVRPMASFTLTADHRVVDGATAARFLSTLQRRIEHPGLLLE